jgi:hypothetical protein
MRGDELQTAGPEMTDRNHSAVIPRCEGRRGATGGRVHSVQFYDEDAALIESVSEILRSGLRVGAACIVIATAEHRMHFGARLRARGFDLDRAAETGQYIALDAQATLQEFYVDGAIDRRRFGETVGRIIERADLHYPRIVAFGEMVALLSLDGKHEMALALEQLWNEIATRHEFSLVCAYPRRAFGPGERIAISRICNEHKFVSAL